MPSEPNECRRQELACVRRAQNSVSPKDRETFANMAKTWLTLAGDLERMDAQLKSEPALRKPG
jgi:hypothetical protein